MAYLSTVAAFGFKDFNPPTLLGIYQRLGCTTCQFYRNTANPPPPREARRLCEAMGIAIDSIHGVFGPEHDPSSLDEPVRRAAVETYRREGELALELGGPQVVVHPAPTAADPGKITPATRAARGAPLRRSMQELAEIGRRQGVIYLMENLPGNYEQGSDAVQLAQWIREIDRPHLRLCFDTGHAHMTGSAPAALADCRDVIGYVHVNDNDRSADSHWIPGLGTLPWEELAPQMALLPADTPAMLELFYSEADLNQQIAQGLHARLFQWLALGEGVRS